jgi:hypothetical protein
MVLAAGGVTVGQLCDAYPTTLPQLVFCMGQALAVLDTSGFWCRVVADGALPSGVPLSFVFKFSGTPVMQIQSNAQVATALTWTTEN